MNKIKSVWQSIDDGIFGYGSPLPMGVFRIFIGVLSLADFAILLVSFQDFFTEKGLYPVWMSERFTEGIPHFNLLAGVTDSRVTLVFLILGMVAAAMTALGLFTRVASIALFVLMLTIHNRNADILMAGDWLLRLWVFAVAVGPSGAVLSLDRKLFGRGKPVEEVSLWPQKLVQFQLAVVYFMTVWLKWGGDLWRNGTATYYAGHLKEFEKFPVPDFIYSPVLVTLATYGTLVVELAMATLVFSKPMRKYIIPLALLMHGFIEYSMNIPLFQWVIVSAFVCHFSGDEIAAWWARLRARFGRGPEESVAGA